MESRGSDGNVTKDFVDSVHVGLKRLPKGEWHRASSIRYRMKVNVSATVRDMHDALYLLEEMGLIQHKTDAESPLFCVPRKVGV